MGGLGEHVNVTCWFLSISFKFVFALFLFYSSARAESAPVDRFDDLLRHTSAVARPRKF